MNLEGQFLFLFLCLRNLNLLGIQPRTATISNEFNVLFRLNIKQMNVTRLRGFFSFPKSQKGEVCNFAIKVRGARIKKYSPSESDALMHDFECFELTLPFNDSVITDF